MRTALRTSIVTAALMRRDARPGPCGAAFAAPAAAPLSASAPASDNSRYEGEPVYIGEGLVAVLRNKAEGPEAWIREVGPQWKPGDNYMVHVVTKLDRTLPHDKAKGLDLELTRAASARPVLVVTAADGSATSYPLPHGRGQHGLPGRSGGAGDRRGHVGRAVPLRAGPEGAALRGRLTAAAASPSWTAPTPRCPSPPASSPGS